MLLIPIAQEDSTVRRVPWVSITLIALCFLAFLAVEIGSDAEQEWELRFSAFLDFLGSHPYLSPPPEIVNLMKDGFTEALEEARGEWERNGGTIDPGVAESEQIRLNVFAQEALEALHATPGFRFGFVPAAPRVQSLITSLFMHSGWLHLLGNMLFLFLTGPFIEDRYGRPVFAGLYVLSGLAAIGAHVAHNTASPVPLVGASGAIAGVMGAFLVRLGARRIRFLFIPIPLLWMLRTQFALPAFVVLPLWLLEQLWYAQIAPEAGVAWWAHVGGFAFGLVAALAMKLFSVEETWLDPAIEKEIGITQNPGLERAMEARLAGDLVAAKRRAPGRPSRRARQRRRLARGLRGARSRRVTRVETGRTGERLLGLLQRQKEDDLANELAYDPRWREISGVPARALDGGGRLPRACGGRAGRPRKLCRGDRANSRRSGGPARPRASRRDPEAGRRPQARPRGAGAGPRASRLPGCLARPHREGPPRARDGVATASRKRPAPRRTSHGPGPPGLPPRPRPAVDRSRPPRPRG